MICRPCAHAADNQLPAAEHCDTTGGRGSACSCQHRPSQRPPVEEQQPAGG